MTVIEAIEQLRRPGDPAGPVEQALTRLRLLAYGARIAGGHLLTGIIERAPGS